MRFLMLVFPPHSHACFPSFPPSPSLTHLSVFIRMKVKKVKERQEAHAELEQSIHLVKAAPALVTDPSLTLPKTAVQATKKKIRVKASEQPNAPDAMEV